MLCESMYRIFWFSSSFACAFNATGLKSLRVAAFFIASKLMPATPNNSRALSLVIQPSTFARDMFLSLATRSKFSIVKLPFGTDQG